MKLHTTAKKLDYDIYQFTIPTPFYVGPVNVYLLAGKELTLVDTGVYTEEAWETLNEGLAAAGFKASEITQILLTHHHVDHVGLVGKLKQKGNPKVLIHPGSVPFVELNSVFTSYIMGFMEQLYTEHAVPEKWCRQFSYFTAHMNKLMSPFQPDQLLNDGDMVPGHPDWKVIHTPGHAHGHISLVHFGKKIMIAGDHLIKEISSNALVEAPVNPGDPRERALLVYRHSLEKCKHLELDMVYSGHGDPITDHVHLIEERLQRQDIKAARILDIIKEGKHTTFEIMVSLFPEAYKDEFTLTFSETLGHLDLLEERKQISGVWKDGIYHYQLN